MLVFGAAKGVETYCELCYGAFQKAERMPLVARSLMLRGLGGAVVFWLLIITNDTVIVAYGGLLLVWALVAFWLDLPHAWRLAGHERRQVHLKAIGKLAVTSLPLAFNALFAALQASTPRYIVSYLLGLAALGQFVVVAYVMQVVTTLTNAVSQSIVARLSQYAATGARAAFLRVLKRFLLLIALCAVSIAAIMLVIGDPLLVLAFGPDYAGLGTLLAMIMMAAGTSAASTMLQAGLLSTRQFSTNLRIRVISFCILATGAALGALSFGLYGVVGGVFVGGFIQSCLLATALLKLPIHASDEAQP